eukprot:497879-Rhodomonas_salina.1
MEANQDNYTDRVQFVDSEYRELAAERPVSSGSISWFSTDSSPDLGGADQDGMHVSGATRLRLCRRCDPLVFVC